MWLVDVIRHAQRITFEEISELWEKAALNTERQPLALRTFHNHRDAIQQLFGIKIKCNRSEHKYYISDEKGKINDTKLRVWMLQTLSLSSLSGKTGNNVESRVILDITPEEKNGLSNVIDAMKNDEMVELNYLPNAVPAGKTSKMIIEPYCVRFWRHGWYVLGKELDKEDLEMYPLLGILQITPVVKFFHYPEDFEPEKYFRKFYGTAFDHDREPIDIKIRFKGDALRQARLQPLHETQTLVEANDNEAIYSYNLVPTAEFRRAIIGMGSEVTVELPGILRDEIRDDLKKILSLYE